MIRTLLLFNLIFFVSLGLLAQKSESIKIKAGTKLSDYFPPSEKFLYKEFKEGKASFTNGQVHQCFLNYNYLSGEIEFIKNKDTLSIADKNKLRSVVVDRDTFFYHNGYLKQLQGGLIKVYSKQFIKIKDVQKKGAMGTINRSAASESFGYLQSGALSYNLIPDTDIVLKKEEHFYFSIAQEDFKRFNRSNTLALMPWKKEDLKKYIKSNKIDFESKNDLLKLATYMNEFLANK